MLIRALSIPGRGHCCVLILFGLVSSCTSGCRSFSHPTCAVHEELADDHCREFLYHSDCSGGGLQKTGWQRGFECLLPGCPSLFCCARPPRTPGAAETVFRLPEDAFEFDNTPLKPAANPADAGMP